MALSLSPPPSPSRATGTSALPGLQREIRDHSGHLQVASIGETLVPESVLHHTYALLGLLPQWQRQCFGALGWQVYISGQPLETLYPLESVALVRPGTVLGGLFLKRSGVVVTATALARQPLTLFHELAHGLDLVLALLLPPGEGQRTRVACSQSPAFARVYAACMEATQLRAYARSSALQLFAEGLALASYDPKLLDTVPPLRVYLDDLMARAQEVLAL
jgi:hypothetical protein